MTKNFTYAPALRDHMSHPHGVRVFQMVDQMFAAIARASGERGMRFHCVPDPQAQGGPTRKRDVAMLYRQQFTTGTIQVPMLQCSIDLVYGQPEARKVRDTSALLQMHTLIDTLGEFIKVHYGSVYGGCGLQFNDIAKLMLATLKTSSYHCVGQLSMWPLSMPGDDRDRDMAVMHLVLKDELDAETDYDYQISLVWNGPDRFQKMLFRALNGQPMA